MKRILQLVLLVVFWTLPLHSQEVVQVSVGHGKAKVISSWSKEVNDQLSTMLLVDEDLAPLVMGKKQVVVQFDTKVFLDEDDVHDNESDSTDAEIHKAKIQEYFEIVKEHLLLKLDNVKDLTQQGRAFKGVVTEGKKKVVMGTNEVVMENESFDEVTVLGGSLEVYGTIKKLVVMGGEVHLKNTAIIEEELNIIGGYITKDDGAQVLGKEINMSWPLNEGSLRLIFKNFELAPDFNWLNSTWFKITRILFYVFVVFVFMALANYIAPEFQSDSRAYLQQQPVKSAVAGIIYMFLTLPLTVFLVLTIIGIPLLPLQYSFLILFLVLGYGHVSEWMAQKIFKGKTFIQNKYVALVLGLLIIELLSLIPVVGWSIKVIAIILGFGAASKVFQTRIFRPGFHYSKA